MSTVATLDKANWNPDDTKAEFISQWTIVLTANYGGGATHGDTLAFLSNKIKSWRGIPLRVEIYEQPPAGTSASGFSFNYSPGTTASNGVMQVFGTPAAGGATVPNTEYTQGAAYSAGLLAAVLKARVYHASV